MFKKSLVLSLVGLSSFAFAEDNANYSQAQLAKFQNFDNQISIGFSMSQMTMANGVNNQSLQQSQYMNFEAERLFDNAIWADLNASMMTATNSLGNQAGGTGMGARFPASQDPFVGGFNAKLGYSLPYQLVKQDFMATPYLTVGRNTNLAMSTILANNQSNVTNDYFLTTGLGVRFQYAVNKIVNIYFDQSWAYNFDQSQPLNNITPQDVQVFNSTLGAKFNVWQQLQIGLNMFYNNYQYNQAGINTASITGGDVASVYRPSYNFGGGISIGMTY
jgi:hypothetical protein